MAIKCRNLIAFQDHPHEVADGLYWGNVYQIGVLNGFGICWCGILVYRDDTSIVHRMAVNGMCLIDNTVRM